MSSNRPFAATVWAQLVAILRQGASNSRAVPSKSPVRGIWAQLGHLHEPTGAALLYLRSLLEHNRRAITGAAKCTASAVCWSQSHKRGYLGGVRNAVGASWPTNGLGTLERWKPHHRASRKEADLQT